MTTTEQTIVSLSRRDVSYLPLPNRVDLILSDVPPPLDLTRTAFVIGIAPDGGIVLANHSERGLEITGGHVDPGETLMMAARREGGEESGAEYGILWPIGYLKCTSEGTVPDDHPYPHPEGYQAIFAGSVISMQPREDYLECNPPIVLSVDEIASIEGYLGQKIALLHAAAITALGRDRSIEELAQLTRLVDGEEWDSQRQIDAENRFFDECRRRYPLLFPEGGEFDDWCLKATPDEMVGEAMRLIAEQA